ncbi:chorismate mutase [Candidatus Woesearchaeota archaeon]|nr:chorismate mutase [Candidatus Woesearchaeota archaeon]
MIKKLRSDIDKIDDKIIELLKKRLEIVDKIFLQKDKMNLNRFDKKREDEIIKRLEEKNLISKKIVKKYYKVVFENSKNRPL